MTCTPHLIFFGWSIRDEWDERDM